MIKVLFVCLGNICRSPMAEGIFNHLVQKHQLREMICCDSAGIAGYHIGEMPDERMCLVAEKHQITLRHLARKISKNDFDFFDYILVMDSANYAHTIALNQQIPHLTKAQIRYMSASAFDLADKAAEDVPDPYYGSMQDFENVFQMLWQCSEKFLTYLIEKHQLYVAK